MKLSFHGAVRGVTGSCFLLTVTDLEGAEHRLLFDCGLYQGERMCGSKNFDDFGFDPASVDAVFITHPHADHTGRLPKLFDEGYTGPVYMTEPCVGLSRLVLEDAFHIMSENAERCDDKVLYQEEDLNRTFAHIKSVAYHEHITIAPGVTVTFFDAGHVLGSAWIRAQAEGKSIVFSGDIGNDHVPILPETQPIRMADYVVAESTYGNRAHEPTPVRSQKLRECIEQTIKNKSVLMIPAFSIERTQELLYELNHILKDLHTDVPIFLDSPMAIRATQLYRDFKQYLKFDAPILQEADRDFFSFPNLRETLSRDESMAINHTPAPKIIIAGSGMMSGGRIMHHLRRYLQDAKNMLLIIGYQAYGTLGRRIFDGAKRVTIYRESVAVRAQVRAIGSFSAHGDKHKMARWLRPTEGPVPKKIFLTHGDPDAKPAFAAFLKEELNTELVIPGFGEEVEL